MRHLPKQGDVIAWVMYAKVDGEMASVGPGRQWAVTDLADQTRLEIHGADLMKTFASAVEMLEVREVTQTELAKRLTEAEWRPFTVAFVKADGSSRTLVGHLVSHEDLMGRSMVRDLEVKGQDAFRLVDHRTLQSLTIDGVVYVVKKRRSKRHVEDTGSSV